MFNFRADDLDALLAKLRDAGADVDEEKGVEEMERIGRFDRASPTRRATESSLGAPTPVAGLDRLDAVPGRA